MTCPLKTGAIARFRKKYGIVDSSEEYFVAVKYVLFTLVM